VDVVEELAEAAAVELVPEPEGLPQAASTMAAKAAAPGAAQRADPLRGLRKGSLECPVVFMSHVSKR
jgi:hypothetical protein